MHSQKIDILDRIIHTGLILLAAVSLIAFGAKHPYGQAAAILLAAGLLLLFGVRMAAAGEFRLMATPLDLAAGAFLLLVLAQMGLGYPWGWTAGSPAALMEAAAKAPGALASVPGTLDFHATRSALVLFLVYAGVFYLTVHSLKSRPLATRLVVSLVVLVAAVAFYGLFEYLSGNHGILGWKAIRTGRVRGTLVNPDHFAATLGMVIPIAVGYLLGSSARRRRRRSGDHGPRTADHGPQTMDERGQFADPSSPTTVHGPSSMVTAPSSMVDGPSSGSPQSAIFNLQSAISSPSSPPLFEHRRSFRAGESEKESRRYLLLLTTVFMVVAVFFTMSRAGIVAVAAGGAFLTALLWIREPAYRRRLTGLTVGLAALAIIAWMGADLVLSRFAALDVTTEGRTKLYQSALAAAQGFPLLGTGLGTYFRISPRYASPEFGTQFLVDHAHSEPLQLLVETGLPGLLILLLALAFLFRDLLFRRLLGFGTGKAIAEVGSPANAAPTARHDPFNIALGFGALAALATVLVHSCFDFPLRIPANGILLAMILGIGVSAVGTRYQADGGEPLMPVRVLRLAGAGRGLAVLAALGVAFFMAWTALAGLAGSQLTLNGVEIMRGGGTEGRQDRPWIVETSKNKEALAALGRATAFDPLSPDAHHQLGRLYGQLALRAWNAGLSEEGRFLVDAPARVRAALDLLEKSAREHAEAIRLAPSFAEAWSDLGWLYGIRSAVVPYDPARSAEAAEDSRRALAALRQAIALNPNNRYRYEVLAAFGFARLESAQTRGLPLGDPVIQEGLAALRQAVVLDPGYLPDALGRVLRRTDEVPLILAAVPEQAPDLLFAARILEEQELWPQAKALFRRAVEIAADDAKPLYYREFAEALNRHGEDREMRDVLHLVLRFDPQNLDLRLALAHSLQRLNQNMEALAMFQEALESAERASRDLPIRRRPAAAPRTRVAVWSSREERVLAEIERRFPGTQRAADPLTRALGALAAFYHAQGQDNLAVPLWEKALSRTPDDAATAFGLARSYDAVGAWVSAVDFYKKAIELNRGSLEYRLTLARRYFENDMNFQAINLWREVLAVRPTLVSARLQLAEAFVRLEQYPDALREFERVLQIEPGNAAAKTRTLQLRGKVPGA